MGSPFSSLTLPSTPPASPADRPDKGWAMEQIAVVMVKMLTVRILSTIFLMKSDWFDSPTNFRETG